MPRYQSRGLRAPKGSTPARVLVPMSEGLHDAIRSAAKREGISVAEFIRRALADKLAGRSLPDLARRF